MTRFEIGQTYFMRDPFDRAKRILYVALRRTPQNSVVFRRVGAERTFRRKAYVILDTEYCCPDGRFDESRVLRADNLAGAEP